MLDYAQDARLGASQGELSLLTEANVGKVKIDPFGQNPPYKVVVRYL